MSCCGQKREALTASYRSAESSVHHEPASLNHSLPAQTFTAALPVAPTSATVTLLARARSAVFIKGPVTGKRYHFNGPASMQAVDKQDAEALLASGAFERVWG